MKDFAMLAITLLAIVLIFAIAAWVTVEGYWWFGLILVLVTTTIRVKVD